MIHRSPERIKQNGEVFTPAALVIQLLNLIPNPDWTALMVDPYCGDGNILVEILNRKLLAGLTPYQALTTTRGVDIMPDNVTECRRRLLNMVPATTENIQLINDNIVCADSIHDFDICAWKSNNQLIKELLSF